MPEQWRCRIIDRKGAFDGDRLSLSSTFMRRGRGRYSAICHYKALVHHD